MADILDIVHEGGIFDRKSMMRVIEYYCGLGGFAAAIGDRAEVVLAIDQNRHAVDTYRHNFNHPVVAKCVETLDPASLAATGADLWWASPPCQPFSFKGKRKMLADPRAATFLGLLKHLEAVKPTFFAMENVVGFYSGPGHDLLLETLTSAGYDHRHERILCPSVFGIPNRRPRYFIVAGRQPLAVENPPHIEWVPLAAYLDPDPPADLAVNPDLLVQFAPAVDLIHADDPHAVAQCFTSGYGRSAVGCGSYLALNDGTARYLTPAEITRLLGFPAEFGFPTHISRRQAWKMLGNSLSIPAVRAVIQMVPVV